LLIAAGAYSYPQPTEWQRIGNQIDAAMIFTRVEAQSGHPERAMT
jgi:hypothetical protein